LIALCCIGPALFLLFGVSVGALGMFSVLEPYQPIFIGAGLPALAFPDYRILRESPAEEACANDSGGGKRLGSTESH
jgi:mercuric ion transport protein